MRKQNKDVLIAGLMLFAMFLGAGNVIFPPYVGVQTGSRWLLAAVGFLVTGAGLPLIGILSVSKAGGEADGMCQRAWPVLGKILNVTILLMIGPLFAIPRTAATTCEMSVLPFLPVGVNTKIVFVVVSAIFFLLTYFLTRSSSEGLDKIGSILSPLLIIFLFITIIISIVKPIGSPVNGKVTENLFYYGVINGYQTMDGIGSIVMGGAVAFFIQKKGYNKEETISMLPKSALIAGILLGCVYLGYVWIGASGSANLMNFTDRTQMLSHASYMVAGPFGKILLALIIFFACLTTSSGLVITFSEYFAGLSKGKISRKNITLIAIIFSFVISLVGVEGIIKLSVPVLEIIYPLVVALIILNLFTNQIKSDYAFRGAMIGVIILLPAFALKYIPFTADFVNDLLSKCPLGKQGFAYIPFAVGGFIVGYIVDKIKKQK